MAVAASVMGLGLIVLAVIRVSSAEDGATVGRTAGAIIGALAVPALLGGLFSRNSLRAGLIAFIAAAAGVALMGTLARLDATPIISEEAQEQIDQIAAPLPSAEYERCITDEAEGRIELDAALNDPDANEERQEFVQILLDCVADPGSSPYLFESLASGLELATNDRLQLSSQEGRCLLTHIIDTSDDPARTLAVGDREGDLDVMLQGLGECLTEENKAIFFGDEGAGPQNYGDDEQLDGLHDDCSAGDERACDLLYLLAGAGSEYEEFGLTCGHRDAGDAWCTPGLVTDETGFATEDDPVLLVEMQACEDGDNTACDLVRNVAPPGSELERRGYTCGGRIAVGALPDCRTRFGS